MPPRIVLVLTNRHDLACDPVVRELHRRHVDVFRYDTEDFPLNSRLSARIDNTQSWRGQLTNGSRSLALEEVRAVWYRRPTAFGVSPDLTEVERSFAIREARFGLGGVFRGLPVQWINEPDRVVTADYKPYQLTTALRHGLSIPRTLITNDASSARAFRHECSDDILYKTLSGSPDHDTFFGAIYTSPVDERTLSDDDAVRHTACLFQERIEKARDLRVTIIGDDVFTVAIACPPEEIDWRAVGVKQLQHTAYSLPSDVESRLRGVIETMGLRFAAVDMVLTPDGDHVFLEVNANGQWAWLEASTGMRLSEAMASLLAGTAA